MPEPRTARLFIGSAVALFLELALIRWVASEIRVFAYFKSLVLVACFLGFGLGFHRSTRPARLGASLAVLVALVAAIALPPRLGLEHGPAIASRALSNLAGTITMNDRPGQGGSAADLALGLGWTAALFVACIVVMIGYAQRLGADIDSHGPEGRLFAYSVNVAGSLAGVVAFAVASRLALPPIAWSPYQKLEFLGRPPILLVNGTGYMAFLRMPRTPEETAPPFHPGWLDRWRLPHRVRPGAKSVLVIGAGGGNDVAAALLAGASRVVAVEIDPTILEIGRRNHPDRPYDDPRVEVVLDDARHYGEVSRERFDLVVFSHLDSHEALSGFTNVRLDNYVHTVESFRSFRGLLAPGGALYVSFHVTQPWVAERLRANLTEAFGAPPVEMHQGSPQINAHFIASDDPAVLDRARETAKLFGVAIPASAEPVPPSTDDWPYLYVERRSVPRPIAWLAALVAACAFGVVGALLRERDRGPPLDRHFFFLGAAFLLVEVHNVGKLARVFGTTWSVNAWVITGVLSVILLANVVAARARRDLRPFVYPVLLACVAAAAAAPLERILALPGGALVATLFYTAPLFFAGLIFAASFRETEDGARALGANILGSVLGGLLEPASFVLGISGLLWIACALYAASYPFFTRPRSSSGSSA
jgi:SAM-dependent methyltransferase